MGDRNQLNPETGSCRSTDEGRKIQMENLIAEFCKQNPEAGHAIFNERIARESDPAAVAHAELLREWFCNSEFRGEMANEVYRLNA